MFKTSIDNKRKITDPNGNEIVDLTTPTFRKNEQISQYFMRKVPSDYRMRPDLISLAELGTTDKTEYIMMFNQIGNPFSIDKDDILLIPELIEADSMVYSGASAAEQANESAIRDILVKNYYKHSNRNNTVDMSSYDDFLNTKIPSGQATSDGQAPQGEYREPYYLKGNEEAVVIVNGRIYFNDENDVALAEIRDSSNYMYPGGGSNRPGGSTGGGGSLDGRPVGNGGQEPDQYGTSAGNRYQGYSSPAYTPGTNYPGAITIEELDSHNVDAVITNVINGVDTDLSEANCIYNGTNLSEFIKAINETKR